MSSLFFQGVDTLINYILNFLFLFLVRLKKMEGSNYQSRLLRNRCDAADVCRSVIISRTNWRRRIRPIKNRRWIRCRELRWSARQHRGSRRKYRHWRRWQHRASYRRKKTCKIQCARLEDDPISQLD